VESRRYLIVMADDYGIGPPTSKAILDLAARGLVTATVLLVNSPSAVGDLAEWRRRGTPVELGWHPCLTLDRPVASPQLIPSLVRSDGSFYTLGPFLRRLLFRKVRGADVAVELAAQYQRFRELVGHPPAFVNGHQHIHVFSPIAQVLAGLLSRQIPPPYVRRVREAWKVLVRVPGARIKRSVVSSLGLGTGSLFDQAGAPGNDWLAGVTNPACVADPQYFARWLCNVPGRVVELACHPGYWDDTLIGRDCKIGDGKAQRRVDELNLMLQPSFVHAVGEAGFTLVSPSQLFSRESSRCRAA
jgi:chitin disaccharide deacetylase